MLLLVAMGLGIGEAKAETVNNVKYIDADGQTKYKDNVTVLTGNETVLGSTTTGGGVLVRHVITNGYF